MKRAFQLLLLLILFISCSTKSKTQEITFIEIGSVRCIPCIKMQEVVKEVEKNYSQTVHTVFYDVMTEDGKIEAKKFKFKEIPTQIFLDKNGEEFARHIGYLPYEDLEKILKQKIE